jgi:hypothetical protein
MEKFTIIVIEVVIYNPSLFLNFTLLYFVKWNYPAIKSEQAIDNDCPMYRCDNIKKLIFNLSMHA